jgi:hypothetical protein
MTNSKPSSDEPDTDTLRLVRIETKLSKIMVALGLDPNTGNAARKKNLNQPLHNRTQYDPR